MKAGQRNKKGVLLAEAAASLCIMLPLLITVTFVALESNHALLIKNAVNEGVREAARGLAVYYGQDPTVAASRSTQNKQVYDNIRVKGIIASSQQFESTWDTTAAIPTVTVKLTFAGGQYGLPPFPNPDPLNLGSRFRIESQATYRLE